MGGGKIKDRCLEHMEKGYKIAFEDLAARTIRDNIEQVKSYGFEIAEDNAYDNDSTYSNYTKISLKDVLSAHLPNISPSKFCKIVGIVIRCCKSLKRGVYGWVFVFIGLHELTSFGFCTFLAEKKYEPVRLEHVKKIF